MLCHDRFHFSPKQETCVASALEKGPNSFQEKYPLVSLMLLAVQYCHDCPLQNTLDQLIAHYFTGLRSEHH